MEVGKVIKSGEDLFFFLLFTSENDKNLFWVYQNGNFLPGKNISRREKNQENDFAPSEKYACYSPDQTSTRTCKFYIPTRRKLFNITS